MCIDRVEESGPFVGVMVLPKRRCLDAGEDAGEVWGCPVWREREGGRGGGEAT